MQAIENYPIIKTCLSFVFIGGIWGGLVYTIIIAVFELINAPTLELVSFLMTLLTSFLWGFISNALLSLISFITLTIFKFKINKPSKYAYLFSLGFLLTLPICYILVVGFGANKSFEAILFIILTLGIPSGFSNVLAGKFTLPKA